MTMPIRIVRGIGKHFPTRRSEWILAVGLTMLGARILMPDPIFAIPQYAMMASFIDEENWGAACVIVGLARLTALTVNGTLYDIADLRQSVNIAAKFLVGYSRYSPHVRTAMAVVTCFFWFTLALCLWSAGSMIGWMTYGLILFPLDLSNAASAAIDADKVHRDVPA